MSRQRSVRARPAAWAKGVLCALAVTGCAHAGGTAAPARPPALGSHPGAASVAVDPAVLAAAARARAEAARAEGAPGMFENLQLRVRGRGEAALEGGAGIDLGARLKMERPFKTSALADSMRHGADAALWLAHAAEAEARARLCEESVLGRSEAARAEEHTLFRARVEKALGWASALAQAGEVQSLVAIETELNVRRSLLARASALAVHRVVGELGPLPDVLADRGAPLALDEGTVRAAVRVQHPEVLSHLAMSERHRAEALSERRARLPWFDFLQLDYFTWRGGSEALGARVAVGIPLDDGARGRAARAELLGESERHAAEASLGTLATAARAALAELAEVEARAADYRALLKAAEAAEVLAARLIDERRGPADKALGLLDDAQDARDLVREARERAGVAACTLELSTGKDYAAWPRAAD
jgi:hypothetical protein